ncbi:PREDICTED: uncharacterized protein LOC109157775 [Ipomoea nil]|uniref:uncharacterized protein LOC109157775 n=1 Tax=Ipomoea nil TaxID=35883 RepID=UPI0009011D6C|nr:PREDICTED: uncharacterized protein LOC109157775 [Ipomoea nil]
MFTAWFDANSKYSEARNLTYAEMPTKFVWKKDKREWHPRQRKFAIGRIFYVPPNSGEIFYLRCLLNIVRGPRSFGEIKYFEGVQYTSFRDACYAHGLIEDDKEYVDAISEAAIWSSAHSLRKLFVTLLTSNSMAKPEKVWDIVWKYLADDVEFNAKINTSNPEENGALMEVEKLLNTWNWSLSDYPPMSMPVGSHEYYFGNRLLYEKLAYDKEALKLEHESLFSKLTDEQLLIYNKVMVDVESNKGGLFFVYGYGGTGNTFLWRTLSATLRSKREVVLNVTSSGIASLLLPGGRTAHSRFPIPIAVNENATCNISQGSPLAELIIKARLIIGDEAPMMHKHCFEALDRTMRDIAIHQSKKLRNVFWWKNSCTWSTTLNKESEVAWYSSAEEVEKLDSFAKWIADLGDGNLGEEKNGIFNIRIPDNFVLRNEVDPIAKIVQSTFPLYGQGQLDHKHLESRAILAPTLDVVDKVNEYMNSMNEATSKTYLSCDSVCKSDTNADMLSEVHTTEFLNSLRCSGVPNYSLTLKFGSLIMLLRNIDHSLGLCNGTRLIITQLGNHVIEAQILCGNNVGTRVLIPRLGLTPSDLRLPFKFQRKQFPIMLSYAMTINKSQGQTLSNVGLLLKKPVFNHG